MKLLLLAAAVLVGVKSQSCSCDDGKDFVRATGSCDAYPKSGDTNFVENCHEFDYDNTLKKWKCDECKVQFYKDATGSTCTDGGIANCDDYENATTCEGCADGHYLDGNACVANPATPANCKKFTKGASAAECSSCKDGYYLKAADKTCVENPTTVVGCHEYEDNNGTVECDHCEHGDGYTGLDGQTCYKIADKIPDCVSGYAKSSGVYACSGCSDGKMAEDKGAATDACVANPTTEADGMKENCSTYRKSSAGVVSCVACNAHFGLKADGTCEDVGAGKVENCGTYELVGSAWKCDRCDSKFYSDVESSSNPTVCAKCPETKKGGDGNSASILTASIALFMLVALLL